MMLDNRFQSLVQTQLAADFCSDPARGMLPSSFQLNEHAVSQFDAEHFLRAWDAGLLHHEGGGIYRYRENGSWDQFFWSGPKGVAPRSFSLWIEPIITAGAIARLHFDFGWPLRYLRSQSVDGAFDLVAYSCGKPLEHIAGEVKKSARETHDLVALMKEFGARPGEQEPATGKKRNAFKKVAALRARKPPLFWAIGPNALSSVFEISYGAAGTLSFEPVAESRLSYLP